MGMPSVIAWYWESSQVEFKCVSSVKSECDSRWMRVMQEIRGSGGGDTRRARPISGAGQPQADLPPPGIKAGALPRLSRSSPSPIPRTRRRPCPATLLTQTLRSAEIQDPFPLSETHFFRYRTLSLYPETEDERALRLEGAFEQRDSQAHAVTGNHVHPRFEPSQPRPQLSPSLRIASQHHPPL